MGRYDNIPESKDSLGRRVRRSVLMPTITPSLSDIYIITTVGDRLDLLAHKYYGDVSYWWIIAQANVEFGVGKGTMTLPTGIQLRIPANPIDIVQRLDNLNK